MKSIPIPTHLQKILNVDEAKYEENNLDGEIQCQCGSRSFRLKTYSSESKDSISVKKYKDDYGLRVVGTCTSCSKDYDLFDMAKHGYNGFVCKDGISVSDVDLKSYHCPNCQGENFEIAVGVEVEDQEQFIEEVVEDEPDQFSPEDYVDAFDWFTMSIRCTKCNLNMDYWVDMETS